VARLNPPQDSRLDALLEQLDLPPAVILWLEPALRVMLVLLIGWALHRLMRLLIRRFETRLIYTADLHVETAHEARKRVDTLVSLLRQVVNIFLFVILALVLLMQLGVQVGPLIAGAGIIGVAVGFGAQYLVRDIITGFFMVLENQIRVGDVVTINGTGGLVEMLTLRTIVLRDGAGVVHVVPHGNVTTLSNATRDWSAYVFNVAVSSKEDPQQVTAVLQSVIAAMREDPAYGARIIAAGEVNGIDKLDGGSMTLNGRIKTLPGAQSDIGREFLRRLRLAFHDAAIEMASNAQTLQLMAPPAALELPRS
jgi:small-conductance mechanosensitive channel